jgi:hypothetical protein
MVSGVVPADPPTPALSNVMTRRVAASADQRRVPVVQVATEMLQQDQRHRARAAAAGVAVGVLDSVGRADSLVGQLRISLRHG